jgi:hypothetical protein
MRTFPAKVQQSSKLATSIRTRNGYPFAKFGKMHPTGGIAFASGTNTGATKTFWQPEKPAVRAAKSMKPSLATKEKR